MDLGPTPGESSEKPRGLVATGTLIDGCYRVIERIGEGGMGEVLRCRDEQLDRDVAIKLVRPGRLHERLLRLRFLDEARAMARVRHPNVVTVHAFGELGGMPYFVMEYVPGIDLAKLLAVRGRLPPQEAFRIVEGILQGVEAIHEAGTVHGDLKPGNVLVGPGARISVIDLGLARLIGGTVRDAGPVLAGTPAYMAPECLTDMTGVHGPAIDVYATGVIAYELLTGRLPFSGRALEVMTQHAYDEPTPPSLLGVRISSALEEPVMQALEKDPERRPTAAALLRRIRETSSTGPTLRRILLVDDDAGCLRATRALLEDEFPDVTVEAHDDPRGALDGAFRRPPDVALVDLHMPGFDGFEAVRALRANPKTAQTAIIVLTGLGGARDWQRLRAMGASAFLVKPLDGDDLTATIRRVVAPRPVARKV